MALQLTSLPLKRRRALTVIGQNSRLARNLASTSAFCGAAVGTNGSLGIHAQATLAERVVVLVTVSSRCRRRRPRNRPQDRHKTQCPKKTNSILLPSQLHIKGRPYSTNSYWTSRYTRNHAFLHDEGAEVIILGTVAACATSNSTNSNKRNDKNGKKRDKTKNNNGDTDG